MGSERPVGVCDHVSAKVAGVVETGCALTAGVRLLSGVCPQVDLQTAVLREAFSTLRTCVRLLARVNAHVDAKCGLIDKRLAAQRARDRRLPGVTRAMYYEVFAAVEALATEVAVQGFVGGVREDILLLWELAHVTGVPHLTLSYY